jgi:hypothetical protein
MLLLSSSAWPYDAQRGTQRMCLRAPAPTPRARVPALQHDMRRTLAWCAAEPMCVRLL